MRIQILQIAGTKDRNLAELEQEYEKRLSAFAKLETLSLPASKKDERHAVQEDDLKHFLPKLDPEAYLIALDEHGAQKTSEEFAKTIAQVRDFGEGKIQILIGGSHGLHPDLLAKAKLQISFSKMTFTHEMIRVFLKEQLYRAFTILAGKTYHK